MADEARAQAEGADREITHGVDRGPLHGAPISIKDLFDIKGVPTTAASRVRDRHIADADAVAIARLRTAGAVFLGKTNLHEFAFGTTTEESAFGAALNPRDTTRSPGGSSGGSAISVAAGMALASIGTDTGGSIRIPAAACGIVGLKPTLGEIPTVGVVPLSRSLDHVGPLTRTVGDAWLVWRALGGDPTRSKTLDDAQSPPTQPLRLAAPRPYFFDVLDDDVRAQFEAALERLRTQGARVDDTAVPHARSTVPVYLNISLPEATAYHASVLDSVPEKYSRPVRLRLELGRYVLAEDYVRATNGREQLRAEVDAALDGYDALVLPTLPIPAPRLGEQSLAIGGVTEPVRSLMLRNTQLFNLTGHPAISIPCGETPAGLPCGLQLVGARYRTESLLRVALACERRLQAQGSQARATR
jgi:aspartyl-tRNA(Asn)/glutamyl-tRNA(Gln) amidotransferase subunit A